VWADSAAETAQTLAQEMERFIEFTSEYPDDAEFTVEGDIGQPGGSNILEAYRAWLRRKQIKSSSVDQHSHYGMCIDVTIDDGTVWEMIQFPDPWLMILKPNCLAIPLFNASKVEARLECAKALFTEFLEHDPKLGFVGCFTRKEYDSHALKSANKAQHPTA